MQESLGVHGMINRCHVTSVEEAEENVGGAVLKHLRSRSQPHMGKWGAELQRDQSRVRQKILEGNEVMEDRGAHHVRCIGHSKEPKFYSRVLKGLKSLQSYKTWSILITKSLPHNYG